MKEMLYDWNGQNVALFYTINGFMHGTVYDLLMQTITALATYRDFPIYLILIVAWAYRAKRKVYDKNKAEQCYQFWKGIVIIFCLSYIADMGFLEFMKHWLHYPRPFVELPRNTIHLIGKVPDSHEFYVSFPSGHASFAMVLFASLWPALSRNGRVLGVFLVLLVGWSRIAMGYHFPADVVGGMVSSWLIVEVISTAYHRLVTPKKKMVFN